MRVLLAAALVIALALPSLAADDLSFQELEESLTCQCGCGLTVHACNHLQCPSAVPLRQEIREEMATGKSREAILQYFADKYGEKILSSPTTTGFNLAAWITPFVMVLLGGGFVLFTLRRWVGAARRTTPGEGSVSRAPAGASAAHERIFERELKGFDEP